MDQSKNLLAERKNFGRIYDCECGSIHVQVGPVNITFSVDGYMDFVDLVQTSAANFESLIQRAQNNSESDHETHA